MSIMATEAVINTPITEQARIAERIAHLNHLAKREMAVVGTVQFPTPWDLWHVRINAQLDNWDETQTT